MEETKIYLVLTGGDTYRFDVLKENQAPEPGAIEITSADFEQFQSLLTMDKVVQVKTHPIPENGILGYLSVYPKEQPFLRIFDREAGEYGFIIPDFYPIEETDITITEEDKQSYLEREASGAHFRLKEMLPEAGGLFDFVEAYDPELSPLPPSETDILKEQLLQQKIATAEAVEKQETDKIEQQLAQAEMFETILQMLEPQGGGEV